MILTLLFSTMLAQAAPIQAVPTREAVDFPIWEQTGAGNQTFYSCDGLEDLTKSFLQKLGATNVQVSCSGGIDQGGIGYDGSPDVQAKFTALRVSAKGATQAGNYRHFVISGRDNCAAAQAIFAGIRKAMSITGVTGDSRFCESYERYDIEGEVLN